MTITTSSATRTHFSGVWLPLITPFRDGALDEASLRKLLRHYAGQPIDGIILAGTTGESLTLDDEELQRLVDVAAVTLDGTRPLLLGLSGSDTRKMLKTLGTVGSWPIDGYLITCPYYTRPSQEGMRQHFEALADKSTRPILIYNIPYRTGVNLSNETLLRLAERPTIVGVKDCCGDAMQSFELIRSKPEGFSVLTGEDAQFRTMVAQGADGGILAAAHAQTAGFARVRERLLAGDAAGALEVWRGMTDLVNLMFAEPNPAAIKHWLWLEGLIASPELRLPMTAASPALAARLAAEHGRRQAKAA
ncbi:MAG: 4-hydroxy-tetrahydrodipicolinate synthase [Alphaproteobacteria bacterium]|nr:4-hydroxy-tetrahydrodipicolinate synthase [Alphaproteobacteria bacterium]MCW5741154.1 4-hydroxy-tetrahydrodipicolinate synthase [Alphaproteobacteria bacterium]